VKRYLAVYLTYVRMRIRGTLSFRSDFWVLSISMIVRQCMALLFIYVVVGRIGSLAGWTLYEVTLMYGFLTTARGLASTFLAMPWSLGGAIQGGSLDLALVRPAPPLFLLVGQSGILLHVLTVDVVGIATIVYSLVHIGVPFHVWWLFYIPVAVISGAMILGSVYLIAACLQFWLVSSRSVMYLVLFVHDFAQFPIVTYGLPIRILLTCILPYAMATYYPVAFLTRGDGFRVAGSIAPAVGFVALAIAIAFWNISLGRYKSTGS
jgi:ABC-2 type transport system permease protein